MNGTTETQRHREDGGMKEGKKEEKEKEEKGENMKK